MKDVDNLITDSRNKMSLHVWINMDEEAAEKLLRKLNDLRTELGESDIGDGNMITDIEYDPEWKHIQKRLSDELD